MMMGMMSKKCMSNNKVVIAVLPFPHHLQCLSLYCKVFHECRMYNLIKLGVAPITEEYYDVVEIF